MMLNFNFAPEDVDLQIATEAFRGTSMSPHERGQMMVKEYLADMVAIKTQFEKFATPDNADYISAELETYRKIYLSKMRTWLYAHSRCLSTKIAGRSGFNGKQAAKRSDTADNRYRDWMEWDEAFKNRLNKKYNPNIRRPIFSRDDDAIEQIEEKLSFKERRQTFMKEVNRIVRAKKLSDDEKVDELTGLDSEISLLERELKHEMTEDLARAMIKHGYTFQDFTLRNNGAEIRRLKLRLTALHKEQSRGEIPDKKIGGVTVRENRDEYRLQLIFDEKPSVEMVTKLKSHGFHCTRNNIWQRLLNDHARSAIHWVLGPENSTPTEPIEPDISKNIVIKRRPYSNLFAQLIA